MGVFDATSKPADGCAGSAMRRLPGAGSELAHEGQGGAGSKCGEAFARIPLRGHPYGCEPFAVVSMQGGNIGWSRYGWTGDVPPLTAEGQPAFGYNIQRRTLDPMLRQLAAETPGINYLAGFTCGK